MEYNLNECLERCRKICVSNDQDQGYWDRMVLYVDSHGLLYEVFSIVNRFLEENPFPTEEKVITEIYHAMSEWDL